MALIPVDQVFDILRHTIDPVEPETVATINAYGRTPVNDIAANMTQPPFDSAAMDGYAVKAVDCIKGVKLKLIGSSLAGARFEGALGQGETVRIFTGAPVPEGADGILIQENATTLENNCIHVDEPTDKGQHIRPKGSDFKVGNVIWPLGTPLTPAGLNLVAAANVATIHVRRLPYIVILSTGDELAQLGEKIGADEIVASNGIALKSLFQSLGAKVTLHEVAKDEMTGLTAKISNLLAQRPDILITIGGVSVGARDFVAASLKDAGAHIKCHGVAMRPGKPLLYAIKDQTHIFGLPGNPISSLTAAHIFVTYAIDLLCGRTPIKAKQAPLAGRLRHPNGPRQFYMRATLCDPGNGQMGVWPHQIQDSAHTFSFASCDALLIRPPHDAPKQRGDIVSYLELRPFYAMPFDVA